MQPTKAGRPRLKLPSGPPGGKEKPPRRLLPSLYENQYTATKRPGLAFPAAKCLRAARIMAHFMRGPLCGKRLLRAGPLLHRLYLRTTKHRRVADGRNMAGGPRRFYAYAAGERSRPTGPPPNPGGRRK